MFSHTSQRSAGECDRRLSSVECLRLPSQAAVYLPMSPFPPVSDDDYLAAPLIDLTLSRNIILLHTIVRIIDNKALLPVLIFSLSTLVLIQGKVTATTRESQRLMRERSSELPLRYTGWSTLCGAHPSRSSGFIRLQQLITATELGDHRPSQLLRRMRQLLGGPSAPQEEKQSRELFLQRLQQSMVPVLVAAGDVPLDTLAEMADRVADYSRAHSLNAVTTPPPATAAEPALASIENRLDALVRRLDDFVPAHRQPDLRPSKTTYAMSSTLPAIHHHHQSNGTLRQHQENGPQAPVGETKTKQPLEDARVKPLIWFADHMGSHAYPLDRNASEVAHPKARARGVTRRVRRVDCPRRSGDKQLPSRPIVKYISTMVSSGNGLRYPIPECNK
ncbi:hypothetical protein HPB51_008396 [Rhipicephalus microplus]|uniref:Tick transposon n=1 Tax=Rhipicephalus microplus TaxID=6941 RepID=A0A9J6DU55_RHIMP|nr:hypothetical protein HPB51_008396 [Rhipicephalus microplus]